MSETTFRDPLLDDAFQIVTRFGSQRLQPKEERLLELHPGVPESWLGALFEECDRIETWAYDLGGQIDAKVVTREQALQDILARYPDLAPDTARLTLRHGTYYWWRDNG